MSDLGSTSSSTPAPGWEQQPAPPAYTGKGSGPRAGWWRRFGAWFIDSLILGVVNGILTVAIDRNVASLISLVIGIAYFGFLEGGRTGQTIGKKALGIRVIDANNGGPIGFGRAIIRYFGRIISAIPLLLGYFWMLWDSERQAWHDKFATDYVVPESAYPVR
jgi:uncharacterized RDD family membrane protein YckC